MKIDLTEILVYYISLKDEYASQERMEKMLYGLGFKNIKKFAAVPHPDGKIAGCADSHAKILSMVNGQPVLILEDDCFISTENFNLIIDLPDNTDALYLGISCWGRLYEHSGPLVHRKIINKKISRVYNMLATHAILYLTPEYIDVSRRRALWASKNMHHVDVVFAENQKFYNVYCLNNPLFYQSSSMEVTTINNFNINTVNDTEMANAIFANVKQHPNPFLMSIQNKNKKIDGFSYEPTSIM